jgi:hypothetical protein
MQLTRMSSGGDANWNVQSHVLKFHQTWSTYDYLAVPFIFLTRVRIWRSNCRVINVPNARTHSGWRRHAQIPLAVDHVRSVKSIRRCWRCAARRSTGRSCSLASGNRPIKFRTSAQLGRITQRLRTITHPTKLRWACSTGGRPTAAFTIFFTFERRTRFSSGKKFSGMDQINLFSLLELYTTKHQTRSCFW